MTDARSEEFFIPFRLPGVPMLLLGIALLLTTIPLSLLAADAGDPRAGLWLGLANVPAVLAAVFVLAGLTLVEPNQSRVVLLFGRYVGTLRDQGLWWVNPFTVRRKISLRVHNFQTEKLKVNDLRGNPIEIGAIVVWKVRDTAQAAFDVEDYEDYVEVQSEAAVRTISAMHPYDTPEPGQTSLRGDSDEVNAQLLAQLTERLDLAGVEVLEARINHLAYAPEIAGAMLRRQQAEAIIDARQRIVDGAVGMVKMALDGLREQAVLELDEDRKAAMVSSLLVVLCSEQEVTPVVGTGSSP